jgi:hypothetical protein
MTRWLRWLSLGLLLCTTLAPAATGDMVVQILEVTPPATQGATLDTITGGSSPAEAYPVWTFPDTASTYLDLIATLTKYGGNGLSCRIYWASPGTSGNAVWQLGIRRIQDNTTVITSSKSYSFQTVTTAAPAAGTVRYATVTFTNGAQMDSWGDGEIGLIRVFRDPTNGSDTIGATIQLVGLRCVES